MLQACREWWAQTRLNDDNATVSKVLAEATACHYFFDSKSDELGRVAVVETPRGFFVMTQTRLRDFVLGSPIGSPMCASKARTQR